MHSEINYNKSYVLNKTLYLKQPSLLVRVKIIHLITSKWIFQYLLINECNLFTFKFLIFITVPLRTNYLTNPPINRFMRLYNSFDTDPFVTNNHETFKLCISGVLYNNFCCSVFHF